MVTKYRVVHWQFDNERWARHISAWIEAVGVEAIAEVLDLNIQTVKAWSRGGGAWDFNHPRMSNFIKACDELSLDPRDFFTTSE